MRTTEGGQLVKVTNGADGTYYYYISMKLVEELSLQFNLDGGSGTCTVTVEGTIQDDGTLKGDCDYIDMTNFAFSQPNYTADAIAMDHERILAMCRWVRLKVVASTGAADDADWTIHYLGKG